MPGSVDRAACVDVPALPLQLLLRREPALQGAPVVVVADDRPQAEGAPGVFWLDPSGMVPLFTSFEHWGHGIRQALEGLGLRANVVVGFHRFRCYALCRVRRGVWVLDDPGQESKAAATVPLQRL